MDSKGQRPADLRHTLELLRAFPTVVRTLVDQIPTDLLDWRPSSWDGIPSESLTIRQQICHLRDIERDGYAVRFARVLRETNPSLESIDTYALVDTRDYDNTELGVAFAEFEEARANTVHMLGQIETSDLRRSGVFEGYGPVTVKGLVHYLCSHDQQHLAGIQWLLGRHSA